MTTTFEKPLKQKEQGNLHFSMKDFGRAIVCYSSALNMLTCAPASDESAKLKVICLQNSALCKKNTGDFKGAINDCTMALSLDPKSLKAYLIRGSVHVMTKNFDGASKDMKWATTLDPKNKTVQVEIEKMKKQRKAQKVTLADYLEMESQGENLMRNSLQNITEESCPLFKSKNLPSFDSKLNIFWIDSLTDFNKSCEIQTFLDDHQNHKIGVFYSKVGCSEVYLEVTTKKQDGKWIIHGRDLKGLGISANVQTFVGSFKNGIEIGLFDEELIKCEFGYGHYQRFKNDQKSIPVYQKLNLPFISCFQDGALKVNWSSQEYKLDYFRAYEQQKSRSQ